MKKNLLFFAALGLAACGGDASVKNALPDSTSAPQKVDYAIFSGKITSPKSDYLKVTKQGYEQELKVAEDGSFSDTLHHIDGGYYRFYDGNEMAVFYLQPGYNLNMTLNTAEFDETIKYSSENAEAAANNNFMVAKFLGEEDMRGEDYAVFYGMEEANFTKKIDSIKTGLEDLLDKAEGLTTNFAKEQKIAIRYKHLSYIDAYRNAHAYYAKLQDFTPSEEFLAPLNGMDYDNEEHFRISDDYVNIVRNHYASGNDGSLEFAEGLIEKMKEVKSPGIQSTILEMVAYQIRAGSEDSEAVYNKIMAVSNDEEFKGQLTEKFEKIQKLAKGNPSPQFAFEDVNGKMVKLDELQGKYVYIDVWATWCGPCKAEIPHLKELEEDYKDKNVEFVSISIDEPKNIDAWKTMVAEKELKGVQLIADKAWESDFVQDYAISGIPRFILLDATGNIVSANAPRPSSDGEIREMLDLASADQPVQG